MPESRGGGDFNFDEDADPFVNDLKKASGVSYSAIADRTIGRWAGDRIALVGDYAEQDDLGSEDDADLIYDLCSTDKDRLEQVAYLKKVAKETKNKSYAVQLGEKASRLAKAQLYKDISDDVCAVIEHELRGKFSGDGWREFNYMKKR